MLYSRYNKDYYGKAKEDAPVKAKNKKKATPKKKVKPAVDYDADTFIMDETKDEAPTKD